MQALPQIPQPQNFNPFDSQSYMDIDLVMNDFGGMGGMIDVGMGMNFGMGGGGDDLQRASAMDFETDFTDDDFSFFDRPPDVVPSAPLRMPGGAPSTSMLPELHPGAGLTPAAAGVHQCGAVPSAIGTQSTAGHGNTMYDCNDFIDGAGRRRRAA
jgi:mediator of RNA polymerase II transcription subunit 13